MEKGNFEESVKAWGQEHDSLGSYMYHGPEHRTHITQMRDKET
jgi:hypothetical protein